MKIFIAVLLCDSLKGFFMKSIFYLFFLCTLVSDMAFCADYKPDNQQVLDVNECRKMLQDEIPEVNKMTDEELLSMLEAFKVYRVLTTEGNSANFRGNIRQAYGTYLLFQKNDKPVKRTKKHRRHKSTHDNSDSKRLDPQKKVKEHRPTKSDSGDQRLSK